MTHSHHLKNDLKKLVSGTAFAFAGQVIGNALVYILGIVIGRFLGVDAVGFYFLGLVMMQLASAVSRMGLAEGILRFVSISMGQKDPEKARETIVASVTIAGGASTIIGILLFALSHILAIHVFKKPGLEGYLRWFAAALPVFTVFALLVNSIQALKRMDLVVLVRDIFQPVAMMALALGIFFFHRGPASFLSAHLFSLLLALGVSLYFLGKCDLKFKGPGFGFRDWRVLLAFSLPIGFSDLANYFFRWSDTFLISYFRTSGEVGVYNAALRTTLLLNVLAASVNALYAPMIADQHHHGRQLEVQVILKTIIRWSLTLAMPIVFSIAFLSREILAIWGPEFQTGARAMGILAAAQLVFLPSCILALTLLMSGKQIAETMNTVIVTAVNISLNLFLVPRYGIIGAASSMLVSQSIVFVLRMTEVRYILNAPSFSAKILKPLLAIVPISIAMIVFQNFFMKIGNTIALGSQVGLLAVLSLFVLIGYLGVLFAMGIEAEDLQLLQEIRRKKGGIDVPVVE
jgi:O-antigen/teichoic acid export membrane protein